MDNEIKCTEPRGWIRVRCEHDAAFWVPLRCRHCDACQRAASWKHRVRIELGIREAGGGLFITLTTGWEDSDETRGELMRAWSRMAARLRRRYGPFEAAVKKEVGAKGKLHLHIALVGIDYIPQRTLTELWEASSGWRVTWVNKVRDEMLIGRYLAKYLAKGQCAGEARKSVTYSRGWPKLPRLGKLEVVERVSGANLPYWRVIRLEERGTGVILDELPRDGDCICFGFGPHTRVRGSGRGSPVFALRIPHPGERAMAAALAGHPE